MIGTIINGYTIISKISDDDRPNADIYLCEDGNGNKFVMKVFLKTPSCNIGLSVYNHYGRRRDGSKLVFSEIQNMNQSYDFLVKHIDRFNHNGHWIILLEYIEGILVYDYIYNNWLTDHNLVYECVSELAKTLKKWHTSGFALGDPHLENALIHRIENTSCKIKLIDYSQIHHKDFHYCQKYKCFTNSNYNRFIEDLENNNSKLGNGFLKGIKDLEIKLEINSLLSNLFLEQYYK